MILYWVSKGRFELAKKEIESFGKVEVLEKGILVGEEIQFERLALTKRCGEFICSGNFEEIISELSKFEKVWIEVYQNSARKSRLMKTLKWLKAKKNRLPMNQQKNLFTRA